MSSARPIPPVVSHGCAFASFESATSRYTFPGLPFLSRRLHTFVWIS